VGIWILAAIIIGIIIGNIMPWNIPPAYAKYVSVSFLAALDSVLGAIRAGMEGKFNFSIFSTGFIANALLAALLTIVGDRLGVDLYMAAIVVFGGRIFQNFAFIRRDLLQGKKLNNFSETKEKDQIQSVINK
jgi:small basic protein